MSWKTKWTRCLKNSWIKRKFLTFVAKLIIHEYACLRTQGLFWIHFQVYAFRWKRRKSYIHATYYGFLHLLDCSDVQKSWQGALRNSVDFFLSGKEKYQCRFKPVFVEIILKSYSVSGFFVFALISDFLPFNWTLETPYTISFCFAHAGQHCTGSRPANKGKRCCLWQANRRNHAICEYRV